MPQTIDLSNVSDAQSIWLTQVSYLDITDEGKNLINSEGLTISELRDYLSEGDHASFGNLMGNTEVSQFGVKMMVGEDLTTDYEVLDKLEELGLGDMRVTAIADNAETGFQAMALQDDMQNTGFSFRGSDFNWEKGGLDDWIDADAKEWLNGSSAQSQNALDFFDQNADPNGNNYAFGHSLGGCLTNHVFAENHDQMQGAFSFCGLGIDTDNLSQEQLDAFKGDKYDCVINTGDLVGLLKDYSAYENNVRYAAVRDDLNHNFATSHLPQSTKMDGDKIVSVDRNVAENKMNKAVNMSGKLIQSIDELRKGDYKTFTNALKEMGAEWGQKAKGYVQDLEKKYEQTVNNVQNVVKNAPEAIAGKLDNAISSIEQLFGGDGNTFALGEMREGLGFAQQAANFAQDFSKGDFLSMGKDVLDFGQGLEAQMGGGGNILDDAMDLSFGRER